MQLQSLCCVHHENPENYLLSLIKINIYDNPIMRKIQQCINGILSPIICRCVFVQCVQIKEAWTPNYWNFLYFIIILDLFSNLFTDTLYVRRILRKQEIGNRLCNSHLIKYKADRVRLLKRRIESWCETFTIAPTHVKY